jgi:hypothetical protein
MFASPDDRKSLSAAVELKFLVPFVPNNHASLSTRRKPPLEFIEFIETCQDVQCDDTIKLWRRAFSGIASAIDTVPGQSALTVYDLVDLGLRERDCWAEYWIVKKSNSAEPDRGDPFYRNHLWVPVEVTSPKMAWNDPRTLDSIGAVMNAIRGRYHLVSNHTCEVHVHVGRMDGRSFSLITLKKLAMLLWLAEPALRRVKDPKSPNFNHTYTWSFPAREYSRLATALKTESFFDASTPRNHESLNRSLKHLTTARSGRMNEDLYALGLIARAPSHIQLGRLMSGEGKPYRRLGFNFSAFGREDHRARTNPRTVECRFLEGTIDNDVVLSWVQIYVRTVEVSLGEAGNDGDFTWIMQKLMERRQELPCDEEFADLMELLDISNFVFEPVRAMLRDIHGHTRR